MLTIIYNYVFLAVIKRLTCVSKIGTEYQKKFDHELTVYWAAVQ